MRSSLCHPLKEKGHRVHDKIVSSAVQQIFNETAMNARKDNGKQSCS